jgi:predicted polyphosphate/ATP-dependent NAD kinase
MTWRGGDAVTMLMLAAGERGDSILVVAGGSGGAEDDDRRWLASDVAVRRQMPYSTAGGGVANISGVAFVAPAASSA